MSDQILLNGMEFYGHHGCTLEERGRGQVFRVDAELNLDLSKSGQSDALEDTVDYVAAFDTIKDIVCGEPRNLIETVAEEIAQTLLERFKKLDSVKIVIHKPAAPIIGVFQSAAISITRRRHA